LIRCTKVDLPAPAMPIVMITVGFRFEPSLALDDEAEVEVMVVT
jgi:hypothetical protein